MENQIQNQSQQQSQEQQSRGKKQSLLLLLLLLLVSVTVGYAALSATLNIHGTTTVGDTKWDIEPGTPECPDTEVCQICEDPDDCTAAPKCTDPTDPNCTGARIWMEGNTVYFKNLLEKPGDVFVFTVPFENKGTIDAKVSNVVKSELNATAQRFLTYTVTYADGSAIESGDILAAGDSVVCKVTVAYKSSVTVLPTAEELALINEISEGHTGATSLFTITYEQK